MLVWCSNEIMLYLFFINKKKNWRKECSPHDNFALFWVNFKNSSCMSKPASMLRTHENCTNIIFGCL